MPVVEVVTWLLIGIGIGVLGSLLPGNGRAIWIIGGAPIFAWLGGTAGKFVQKAPTNVEAEFSWISLVLAAFGALLFIWYVKMIAVPRTRSH